MKNKQNRKKQQKGLTLISLLVVISIATFMVITVVKLVPSYIENFSVESSLVSIASDINTKKIKPKDIKPRLIKRLEFNNVKHITDENIMISGGEDQSTLSITYEVRKSILGNIDFVMKFNNSEAINL